MIPLGTVERAPLPDPCPECGDRTHDEAAHPPRSELVQTPDGRVVTLGQWENEQDQAHDARMADDDPHRGPRTLP